MPNLEQFDRKPSAWRFLKLALGLRGDDPAHRHILITLADHANRDGVCWPSYQLLMEETGYTSDVTITTALKHWKKAGILTWKKGWGNAHGRKASVYQFHEAAMVALFEKQKAARGNLSGLSDETSVRLDETSVRPDETSVGGGMKPHSVSSKVLVEKGLSKKNGTALKGALPCSQTIDNDRQDQTAKQAHMEEISTSEVSSEISVNGISSPAYSVPTFAEYDPYEKHWGARCGIGRGLTPAEIAILRRMNAEHIRP